MLVGGCVRDELVETVNRDPGSDAKVAVSTK
jgi:hypothetical protein